MNDKQTEQLNKVNDILNGVIGRLSMHSSDHPRIKEAHEMVIKAARKIDDIANDTDVIGA